MESDLLNLTIKSKLEKEIGEMASIGKRVNSWKQITMKLLLAIR